MIRGWAEDSKELTKLTLISTFETDKGTYEWIIFSITGWLSYESLRKFRYIDLRPNSTIKSAIKF